MGINLVKELLTKSMTIEQRLSRLEDIAGINDLPTNGRQAQHLQITYDRNSHPYSVRSVQVFPEKYLYTAGDKVRYDGSNYALDSFTESFCGVCATISNAAITRTVPISDLIPLTNGGASHNWVGNHGVKEWEITAFRSTNKHEYPGVIHAAPFYFDHTPELHYEIYSVRRADGTVWKLGDEIAIEESDHKGTIERFLIIDGVKMGVELKDKLLLTFNLNYLVATPPSGNEWEIVEFRAVDINRNFTMTLSDDASGYCNSKGCTTGGASFKNMMTGEQSVKSGHYIIGSIRRLSDGELFTIGDRINYPNLQHSPGGCTIEHFTISDGEIFVNNHQNGTPHTRIKDWIKWRVKQPIFTTADGVPAYEGDTIYWTAGDGEGWLSGGINISELKNQYSRSFPYGYSTRAAAEAAYEKWLYEQPVLTLNDVYAIGQAPGLMKSLVKDKLAKK
jgi:hypothetical protein